MKRLFDILILFVVIITSGCDLQPKIASIPDSVGDFISERYPTLLAEPDSDIYKNAVVDYGIYASPTVYGDGDISRSDYVLYSSSDDYTMPAQDTYVDASDVGMPYDAPVESDNYGNVPDSNVDDLKIPDYVNEKPVVAEKTDDKKTEEAQDEKTELVRAPLREITIEKGDTLYSVSRKYSVPVNDLAVMNKISAPFTLSVGQKLKVPDILSVPKYSSGEPVEAVRVADKKSEVAVVKKSDVVKNDVNKVDKKIETGKTATKQTDKTSDTKDTKKTENKKQTQEKQSTGAGVKTNAPVKSATVKQDKKSESSKSEVKKTEAKKVENKKPETKKTDVKKQETKKVDNKKTDVKKSAQKETKKSEVKKTDAKKNDAKKQTKVDSKKSGVAKNTKQQNKMVARSSSKFSWPVRGKILSGYGSKNNGLFNDGINIQATRGTVVKAAENGMVAYAGNEVKGMGNLVIIQHTDGWMTVYAHMDSFVVRRGHSVSVGQKIGTVGSSGKVSAPQLHFEIRKGTKAYNPVNYLKK